MKTHYHLVQFYRFVTLADLATVRQQLTEICREWRLKGTILLAPEGINASVAGEDGVIQRFIEAIQKIAMITELSRQEQRVPSPPFYRMKVLIKREIVALGVEVRDVPGLTGIRVAAQDWDQLISDPEVMLIDTRNDYEVAMGHFPGAMAPGTRSFREFPDYVRQQLSVQRKQRIAMYCTGGIRCEKASAYLRERGFAEVYQLDGGILKYLAEVPRSESSWMGECFVFDNRVAVGHDLEPGDYALCHACRSPIDSADRASPKYELDISCPHCYDQLAPERVVGLRERKKQLELAIQRGELHIGRQY